MAESSPVHLSVSRKCERTILRALASVGQKAAGEAIGKSETWVSRWKSEGDLKVVADLLAALGLKVVPADHLCYDRQYVENLHYFAERGMQLKPQLAEDDPE